MQRTAYYFGRVAAAMSVVALIAACSSPETSDSLYRSSDVGWSKHVVRCRVLEARDVVIRDDDAGDTGEAIGFLVGGLIGAMLGEKIGDGAGREIAIEFGYAAGEVIGGGAGREAAEKLSERPGIEYSVVLHDGDEVTLVQDLLEGDRVVRPGDTCRLQIARGGKNRVLPAEHLSDRVQAPKPTNVVN